MPGLAFNPSPLPEHLPALARELRGNLTDAEHRLWQCLRREQLGVKFRRQHPVEPYVLDFYCVQRRLVIELDGRRHNDEAQRAHGARRTAWLKTQGIQVLRFWNHEVLQQPQDVLEEIWRVLWQSGDSPPPQPSPAGGGGQL